MSSEENNDKNQAFNADRPIMLVANSSRYLAHYRTKLITCLNKNNRIVTLCPTDRTSKLLHKHSVHIPWMINRCKDTSIRGLIVSSIRAIFLIRAVKPRLIHSHTLKANLIVSLAGCIFDIPCVHSYAGLGRLSGKGRIETKTFKAICKTLFWLSTHRRSGKLKLTETNKRSVFICQNPEDMKKLIEITGENSRRH